MFYDYHTPFHGKLKKSVTSSVNFNRPLENTSPPQNISYSAFIISFTKNVTYSWADMTPIACFRTIIPLSMKNLKKYYILCKFGYTPWNDIISSKYVNLDIPLEMTSSPQNISYSTFIISFAKKLNTVGLVWHLFYLLRLVYPFQWKIKKKCYILCKFGYAPYSEAPSHFYQHKSMFTIVFTKKLHTVGLI